MNICAQKKPGTSTGKKLVHILNFSGLIIWGASLVVLVALCLLEIVRFVEKHTPDVAFGVCVLGIIGCSFFLGYVHGTYKAWRQVYQKKWQ